MADADTAGESGAGERGGKAAAARPETLPAALRHAAAELQAVGVASPLYDARLIAAHLLGCAPLDTMFYDDVPEGFWAAVDRRLTREPLQHILGQAPFGPLDIAVGPGVFIPRPETESLADWGARQAQALAAGSDAAPAPVVVDLCSGRAPWRRISPTLCRRRGCWRLSCPRTRCRIPAKTLSHTAWRSSTAMRPT